MEAGMSQRAAIEAVYLRIDPADIAYVKFLFESYEEVAIVRTMDRHTAVIVLLVVEDFRAEAAAILDDVKRTIVCEQIAKPPPDNDDWLMREMDEGPADPEKA